MTLKINFADATSIPFWLKCIYSIFHTQFVFSYQICLRQEFNCIKMKIEIKTCPEMQVPQDVFELNFFSSFGYYKSGTGIEVWI